MASSPANRRVSVRSRSRVMAAFVTGPLHSGSMPRAPTHSCSVSTNLTWYDAASNLTWEITPTNTSSSWQEALDYCAARKLCGNGGWRLPTISEQRSLIRGCPANQTAGSCSVTNSCLSTSCNTGCTTCSSQSGPGSAGRYWPAEIKGLGSVEWSASMTSDSSTTVWTVNFGNAQVSPKVKGVTADNPGTGRCVRTGR
jgi:hypothetical protein